MLNGGLLLMLGDGHAKVVAVALDVIKLMYSTTPAAEHVQSGWTNGPGHVLFSNLVYQVGPVFILLNKLQALMLRTTDEPVLYF